MASLLLLVVPSISELEAPRHSSNARRSEGLRDDVADTTPHGPIGVARSRTRDGAGVAGSARKGSRAELDRGRYGEMVRVVRDALERATVSCSPSEVNQPRCTDVAMSTCATDPRVETCIREKEVSVDDP